MSDPGNTVPEGRIRWFGLQPPTMPPSLAARPVDPRRRLPIPYVSVTGDEVDFTSINTRRALQAGQQRLCGTCAAPLDYWIAFLGGPASITQRTFSDPPMHPLCAHAALTLCPHIAVAHARRAQPGHVHPETAVPPGFTETKPREWQIGITRGYRSQTLHGAPIFTTEPFRSVFRWHYDQDGHLVPVPATPPFHTHLYQTDGRNHRVVQHDPPR